MRVSDKAIVLQAIKHGDKKFILKLYTLNNGLVTASVALNKNIRSSNIFALSLINVELILKQNKMFTRLQRHQVIIFCLTSQILFQN